MRADEVALAPPPLRSARPCLLTSIVTGGCGLFFIVAEGASAGANQAHKILPHFKKPPRFARSGFRYPQNFHLLFTYSTSMFSNASSPFFASAFASPWRTKHIVTKLRVEKIAA